MITQTQKDTAQQMGARAGQAFVDSGVWPVNPFQGEHETQQALASAWFDAAAEIVGDALRPAATPEA